MTKLRLKAHEEDDIVVISSALQDAILKVGELNYSKTDRHLTLRVSRYQHEGAPARVLCGVRIDGILSLKSRGINRSDPDALMVLLSVNFTKDGTPPGGYLSLNFAGGGELLAKVEALDIMLVDMSEPRPTQRRPLHPDV